MIKRHLINLLCLLTLLSGVGVLSGCGPSKATVSVPAATTTPVATATPTTIAYTSADGQYSLKYPTVWLTKVFALQNTSGAVQFYSTDEVDNFAVEPFTIQAARSYLSVLKAVMSNTKDYQSSQVDTTTTTVSYPSGVWTVASATGVSSGVSYTVRLYGITHSGHAVLIFTFAPTSSATTDQTTYFDPMLTSFTFLK